MALAIAAGRTGFVLIHRPHDDSPCPVTKQHTGTAVRPIENPRKGLGPNQDDGFGLPSTDEVVGDGHPINKPRADGLDVERSAIGHAETVLHLCRSRWKCVVRCGCRANHQVDFRDIDASVFNGPLGSSKSQIRRALAIGSDVSLFDARSAFYPFVSGLDGGRELFVGDDAFR